MSRSRGTMSYGATDVISASTVFSGSSTFAWSCAK
jgi:hypothetical protein